MEQKKKLEVQDKKEIAKKAKLKFLENLCKFQRKADENKNSFQRSYGGPDDAHYENNFRRSYRPSSSRPPVDGNTYVRRSLRSYSKFNRKNEHSQFIGDKINEKASSLHDQKRIEDTRVDTRSSSFSKHEDVGAAHHIEKRVTSSSVPQALKKLNVRTRRRSSRNHKEQYVQKDNTSTKRKEENKKTVDLSTRSINSSLKSQSNPYCGEKTVNGYLQTDSSASILCNKTKEVSSSNNHKRQSLINFLVKDVSLSNLQNSKLKDMASAIESVCSVYTDEEKLDHDLKTDISESKLSDLKSRDIIKTQGKPSLTLNESSHRKKETKSTETLSDLITDIPAEKFNTEPFQLQEDDFEKAILSANLLDDSSDTKGELCHKLHSFDSYQTINSKENSEDYIISDLAKSKWNSLEKDSLEDKVVTNFSIEEAIDSFKKLSLEIDAIKSKNFRQNIFEIGKPPLVINPIQPKAHSVAGHKESDLNFTKPSMNTFDSVFDKEQERNKRDEMYSSGKTSRANSSIDVRETQTKDGDDKDIISIAEPRVKADNHISDSVEEKVSSRHRKRMVLKDVLVKNTPQSIPKLSYSTEQDDSNFLELSRISCTMATNNGPAEQFSVKKSLSASGNAVNFRHLSMAERKERLRKVILKYKNEPMQDSEESSVLSDHSSNSSDIDVDWLEEEDTDISVFSDPTYKLKTNKKMPEKSKIIKERQHSQTDSGSLKDQLSKSDLPPSPRTSVGNMMAMWETKVSERQKPSKSSVIELENVQNKVAEAKSILSSTSNQSSTPILQRRRMSFEKETENENHEDGYSEVRNVESMLSMWENKKEIFNKSLPDNDTDNKPLIGKLKIAKKLFENKSNQIDQQDDGYYCNKSIERPSSPVVLSTSTSVNEAKYLFEKKLLGSEPSKFQSMRQPITKKHELSSAIGGLSPTLRSSTDSKILLSSNISSSSIDIKSSQYLSKDLSNFSSQSDSDDDSESLYIKTNSLNGVHRIKSENLVQKSDIGILSMDERVTNDEISPSTSKKRSPTSKSSIQKKISARRKRSRRSMTQPVTSDDVSSAQQLMNLETKDNEVSTKENSFNREVESERIESGEDTEELSFSDRLNFFNSLTTSHHSSQDKNSNQSLPSKRRFTQPINREEVAEARVLHENYTRKTTAQLERKESGDSARKLANHSLKTDVVEKVASTVSTLLNNFLPASNVDSVKKSISEPNVQNQPKKVGRLSSELRTKFLEKTKVEHTSVQRRSASPPKHIRESISSDTSSTSSSSSTLRRAEVRGISTHSTPFREVESPFQSKEAVFIEESDMGRSRDAEIKTTGSIHDRLKLLEKNKEEGWKKRLKEEKKPIKSSLENRLNQLQTREEKWKKPKPAESSSYRSSSVSKANISDRLNSIIANSESWKNKKGKQNDAVQFTTEAKMAKKDGHKLTSVSSPSMKKPANPIAVSEEAVVTVKDVNLAEPSLNKLSGVLKLSQKGLEPEVIKNSEGSTTEIPEIVNEDFEKFFNATSIATNDETANTRLTNGFANSDSESEDHTPSWLLDDTTDHIVGNNNLSDIGRMKANLKRPSVRNKRSTRNPVKALAAREDIKQSYTEQRSNITKLEQQRIAVVHGHGARFTNAALAGLAYKADLKKINLRSTKKNPAFTASDHKPWREKMLLRVKGRRHVQTRLVEPTASSLNSGDAYLLVLPSHLYAWFGEFSNVIEKAKVQEIADYIIHKGDLGSKATSLNIIKEEQSSSVRAKEFWSHLGGMREVEVSGGAEEDEIYEVNAEATIKTYFLENSELIPYKASWGKLPTMGQLSPTSTYVFDFGAEMYIWHGKEVSFEDRQLAIKLAKALWDQGYDYTEVGFCPFLRSCDSSKKLKGPRPEWGLFARVNENLETALVQEKFEDWSNISREIGDKEDILKETSRGHIVSEMKVKTKIAPDMASCDVAEMHENKCEPLPLEIEGYNIWKGHGLIYDEDGRGLEIVTNSTTVWHATDKDINVIGEDFKGIFSRGETYVVEWRYVISSTGKWKADKAISNDLKSDPKGRERMAYFMYSGRNSTVNEKGASALLATEIEKDIGSQVTVIDEKEPPALSQCFDGGMIILDGKKGSREGFYSWNLFTVRGSCEKEVILHQVSCNVASLRSRSSFVAFQGRQAKVIVWHGSRSPDHCREMAKHAATQILKEKRACLGFRSTCKSVAMEVCEEEDESVDFIDAVGRMRRNKYLSLSNSKKDLMPCPRAWWLHPDKENFLAKELHPVASTTNDDGHLINCFPIVQQQLKDLVKPALVLLENSEGLFLWQSVLNEELTGSSKRQYDINRRLAMETVLDYSKKYRCQCSPLLVHEFHEPVEFTNSFPSWKEPEGKISFDEKRAKKPKPVEEVLQTISRLTYSLEELRATPLPEGVDPNHLETYLSSSDFIQLFEMDKQEFYGLPPWKQQNLRKEKNLF